MNKSFLLGLFLMISGSLFAQTNSIGLSFPDLKTKAREELCVPVNVYQFRDMLSMQYSIRFDPTKLKFIEFRDVKLPYLNRGNFGLHKVEEGIITVVWIDNALKGINRLDGEAVFSLCFEVIGKAGETTEIDFTEDPTPFEAVNLAEQIVKINKKKGKIQIQ
jgi:hypothetical protein